MVYNNKLSNSELHHLYTTGQLKKKRHLDKHQKQQMRRRKQVGKYGITVQQYDQMIFSQNNCCAICRNVFEGKGGTKAAPCIDHCHNTGEVRAILCGNCNKMIGLAYDNTTILTNAINYLNIFTE